MDGHSFHSKEHNLEGVEEWSEVLPLGHNTAVSLRTLQQLWLSAQDLVRSLHRWGRSLQDLSLTWELVAMDMLRRDSHSLLTMWPLVGFLRSSGWPHSHAHMARLIGLSELPRKRNTTGRGHRLGSVRGMWRCMRSYFIIYMHEILKNKTI